MESTWGTPILRVPAEILIMVFRDHPQGQQGRNWMLMRVCKLWHSIVMHTPALWDTIVLTPRHYRDFRPFWRYATTCVRQSGSVLLNIRLEMGEFNLSRRSGQFLSSYYDYPSCWSHYDSNYATRRVNGDAPPLFVEAIRYAEDSLGLVDLYECGLLMTLSILRGEGNRIMERWKSLYLDFSPCFPAFVTQNIWDSIDGPAKNLLSLEFWAGTPLFDDWAPSGFPTLPRLEELNTNHIASLKQIGIKPSNLTQLIWTSVMAGVQLLNMESSTFQSLRVLQLAVTLDVEEYSLSEPRLHLPLLEVLALSGEGHERALERLHVPTLTHLSVSAISGVHYRISSTLTTVIHLLWDDTFNLYRELVGLLMVVPSLKHIHLGSKHNIDPSDMVKFVQGLRKRRITSAGCAKGRKGWGFDVPR